MATQMLDIATLKRQIQITTFHSEENARSFASRVRAGMVVLGDADEDRSEFWVCTMALAAKLERAGYEVASPILASSRAAV